MRKLIVGFCVVALIGGMAGVGMLAALLSTGGQRSNSWGECSIAVGDAAQGAQAASSLKGESVKIVQAIMEIGKSRNMPPRAWQVAIQAGKTESGLRNLTYGDRDSLGIFQMRPSMGWGSVQQVTNVEYQINKFYDVLLQVPGWQQMRPGEAAQRVERSAFPSRYHRWEPMAAHLVSNSGAVANASGCEQLPPTSVLAKGVLQFAGDQIGKPYVWGAEGPSTFDCSGLTQAAWAASGVRIPRVTQDQYAQGGQQIPLNRAQPGDLIFWGTGRDPNAVHHVALYLGNNEVLHAPQPGEVVERTKMWDGGELMPSAVRPVPGNAGAAA